MHWQSLVNQQFWLFGRDVVAECGNRLLLEGGRRECVHCRGKAACYRLPVDPALAGFGELGNLGTPNVMLWGFGLVVCGGTRPVCALCRADGTVRAAPPGACVAASIAAYELQAWPLEPADGWASHIANWLAGYESGIVERFGLPARAADVAAWEAIGKRTCAAATIADRWGRFGIELAQD